MRNGETVREREERKEVREKERRKREREREREERGDIDLEGGRGGRERDGEER